MDRFNFISDDLFRHNLESDFTELEKALSGMLNKSVLILAGSIVEAILIDYLISLEIDGLSKEKLLKWDLNTTVAKCFELDIISEKSKNLSDVIRDYRNLIHPGKAIRTKSFPDVNDAVVAKALVEIIIKEVGEKKQESYGFTAEQILFKIENDTTSEVIWHHFIKKLNIQEKRRLLLINIPERYFKIYNDIDFDDPYPEADLTNLSKFFKSVYKSIEGDLNRDVANEFIGVLLEGSSVEVSHYIESFFLVDYFQYYTPENRQLVKEHLFGYIRKNLYDKVSESLKGISKYLTQKEFEEIVSILYNKVTNSNEKEEIDSAQKLLYHEYQNTDDSNRDYILKFIDRKIDIFVFSETLTKRIQSLKDYLTGDDLPF